MRVLREKRVLITGAAAGIGRALAMRFAREGSALFLLDVDGERLDATAADLARLGVESHARLCDVSQPAEISAAVQAVQRQWGSLDVLVNNAGVCYYGPTTKMTARQWQWLLSINLLAPIQFTRELLPTLLAQPEAHVLNVASMYSFITTPRCTAYHASKFGLLGLSEALRTEYGRVGLGVTALCPGFTSTGFFEAMPSGRPDRHAPTPPWWISTTPERVADRAVAAVYRNKRMVVVTPFAQGMYYLKRFAPGLLDLVAHLGRRRAMKKKLRRTYDASGEVATIPFPQIETTAPPEALPTRRRKAA